MTGAALSVKDDAALRFHVIAALGRARFLPGHVVTTEGMSVLVNGHRVLWPVLTSDQPAVIRWLRSLLRRWSAAARRRARRHRAYLFGPERRRDVAAVERAMAARRGAR